MRIVTMTQVTVVGVIWGNGGTTEEERAERLRTQWMSARHRRQ